MRAEEDRAAPRHVLLLVADDLRPDCIGSVNNRVLKTPTFDRLVREGTRFSRAVVANPICTPSRAELLSGCDSFRNGVLDFGGRLKPELVLWPQAMAANGYRTLYVGKWHNDGRPTTRGYEATRGLFAGGGGRWWEPQRDHHGIEVTGYRGWIFQDDEGNKFPELGVGLTPDISARFADASIAFLRESHERPFFLHVNFTAPHDPLLLPPGYESMYEPDEIPLPPSFLPRHPFDHGNLEGRDERLLPWPRTAEWVRRDLAAYYAVVSHLDEQVGRILDVLDEEGLADETLVIFTSDHGLAMGSHGLRGKQNMYEHTVGVPLLMRGANVPAGKTCPAQLYLRDLYPTVCDLVEVAIPETVQARSLVPVLAGEREEVHPFLFCYFRSSQRMVRQDEWKLIEYPEAGRTQLFNLADDPHERNNLADDPEHLDRLKQMQGLLESARRDAGDEPG